MPVHTFTRPRGRIVEITVESEALRGNLLGDPAARTVAVYLPEGYDGSDARYPVFCYLASFTSSGLAQLGWKAFWESLPQRLDRLRAEQAMGPVIAVMPDAFTSLGGNQYIDSVAMGGWASFLTQDVLPRIDERFRTLPGREHRAVFGKSSGGYGAIVHGMEHADCWGAVACHSGDMGFELLYRADFCGILDALAREESGVEGFLERTARGAKLRGSDFHVLMGLAMAATYDPDPRAPRGIRLPVDSHTCELISERWERWLAHDPVHMVGRARCREALKSLKGLWLDCGDRDQYRIHYGMRAFSRRLELHDIPHTYEEFPGDHSGIDHRLDRSLPFLYRALAVGDADSG
jgi:enterochelin esterase-like enzyme